MLQIIQNDGGWDSLRSAIAEMALTSGVTGIMALACESHGDLPDGFNAFLRECPIPVFGGIFPALIANDHRIEQGNIILGISVPLDICVIPALSNPDSNFDTLLTETFSSIKSADARTIFVFVDGLSARVGDLIDALFNTIGLQNNFIGGGAGSLKTAESFCLITPQGVIRDAAVLAVTDLDSRIDVAHGWQPVAGPYEVTQSENNVILALDYEPALTVYRSIVESHQKSTFDVKNFGAIAQSWPFGMARMNAEFVIRDPIAVRADGGLICVGDVPRGALVHIMHGNFGSLISAVTKIRLAVDASTSEESSHGIDFFMDCISRSQFLGDAIDEELRAVYQSTRPLIGAFTLGEIANSGREYLEFYNKTAVIATIWQPSQNVHPVPSILRIHPLLQ